MAETTSTVAAIPLLPLMSDHEMHCRTGAVTGREARSADPAIVINPAASVDALLSAAMSRVDRLKVSLDAWSCELNSDTTADKLAETLAPLAEEADDLLQALRQKLAAEVAHG